MYKKKKGLFVALAALALLLLSGCAGVGQEKQGIDTVSGFEQQVESYLAEQELEPSERIDSGTAAAAYQLINRSDVSSGEVRSGTMLEELLGVSSADRYNATSVPETGKTDMARLYIYPGEMGQDEVAIKIAAAIAEMDEELPADDSKSRLRTQESGYTEYTYTYSVSARKAYREQRSAWVVGVMVEQTAHQIHQS